MYNVALLIFKIFQFQQNMWLSNMKKKNSVNLVKIEIKYQYFVQADKIW